MRHRLFPLLLIGGVACTSFSGEGADAGSGSEAGTSDAGVEAGGPLVFDFENGKLGDLWDRTGDVKVVTGDCNGTAACVEVIFSGGSTSYFWRTLPKASKVRIQAKIRVLKYANGEVDIFGIKRAGEFGEGAWIVLHKDGLPYFVESAAVPGPKDEKSTSADFAQWTPLEITIQRTLPPKITWRIAQGQDIEFVIPDALAKDDLVLEVGGRYAQNTTQWVVRYDDIQIFSN